MPCSTDTPTDTPAVSLKALLTPGLQAIRRHWLPFVVFEAASLALLIAYFKLEPVKQFCAFLSEAKQAWGLLFSMVSAAVAGVVLPEIVKAILPGHRDRKFTWRDFAIDLAFFAGAGVFVDLQYRLLGVIFGNGMEFSVAIKKVLVDQFMMTPLYGVPYWNVMYGWKANGFRIGPTVRMISPRWYLTTVLPLLLSAWFFWIPMTSMIYSLPATLQFSLFALAMAAWSLIMIFVAERKSEPQAGASARVSPSQDSPHEEL